MNLLRHLFHRLIRLALGPHRFDYWQQRGVHVTPVSVYQPIPDTRTLRGESWAKPSELVGIDMNESGQLELLEGLQRRFAAEYASLPSHATGVSHEFYLENGAFPPLDAKVLYGMVRQHRPRRIKEVGAGFSTLLTAQALRRNQEEDPAYACEFVTIDPIPHDFVRAGVPGLSRLVPSPVQDVPFSEFAELQANDILFIDSTHVLKIGSDVQYEFLELLPRLRPGVLVHVHDVFLPFEYPREWILEKQRFWNEQYLLQAFLACNDSFQVVWGSAYMASRHRERVEAAFASCNGASFWMRRIR